MWPLFGNNGTGPLKAGVRSVAASGNVLTADGLLLVNAASGVVNLQLPVPATVANSIFGFKKIDSSANVVNINAASIDSAPTVQLTGQWDSISVHCDGTAYFVLFRG